MTGKTISIYLPDDLIDWIDDQARREGRKRSNFILKVLSDLRNGALVVREEVEPTKEPRITRTPILRRF